MEPLCRDASNYRKSWIAQLGKRGVLFSRGTVFLHGCTCTNTFILLRDSSTSNPKEDELNQISLVPVSFLRIRMAVFFFSG
jgi:hypothetical protein